ncbi:MAG: Fis family transcriptional regulator [Gammaproteobacteria bacterium]|nr:Fis family transcriptional regulator [Gammaproteobacteria bacterium]
MTHEEAPNTGHGPLSACVRTAVEKYFADLGGQCPGCALYETVMAEVEAPLIEVVMRHADYNQCSAARILGINRNTLRKKLKTYGLDEKRGAKSQSGKRT